MWVLVWVHNGRFSRDPLPFIFFLHEAMGSSSGMGRDGRSLTLSTQEGWQGCPLFDVVYPRGVYFDSDVWDR